LRFLFLRSFLPLFFFVCSVTSHVLNVRVCILPLRSCPILRPPPSRGPGPLAFSSSLS
jgi:hypothetical protein